MSSWSDLYAGDAKQIADAFKDAEPPQGKPFVVAHVNLPGIVPDASGEMPNSPDLLTDLACSAFGKARFTFADSIAEHLAGDRDPMQATDGAYLLRDSWAQMFAGITESQARDLAIRWLRELDPGAAEIEERISETAAVIRSIGDVCRVAQQRSVSLVYTWTI